MAFDCPSTFWSKVKHNIHLLVPLYCKPASGHVHQDLISSIQISSFDSREMAKSSCASMFSSKTAKVPLLDRHLLTAVKQFTGSL